MPNDDHLHHDGPTEGWARDLLLAAADTIEVRPEPRPFISTPRRIPWIPVAAAATVLAVLGAVGATQLGGTDRPPARQPSPPVATSESLGPDQIPSVFGYDADGARRLLESRGLLVTVKSIPVCGSYRRAISTEPPAGTGIDSGDRVDLEIGGPVPCPAMPAEGVWPFLDFAHGRGAPPEFAPQMILTVNGQSTTVTAEQAADPATWPTCDATLGSCPGSALDVIQQASAAVRQWDDGTWEAPTLSVRGGWARQRIWIGFLRDEATDYGFRPWHITLHWQPLSSRPTSVLTEVELTWKEVSVVTES